MPYSEGEWVPLSLEAGATTFQFGLPEDIANDDQLLVYLLNENNPTDTLLSNGPEGNPLLSGTGQYLSYDPGLVSIADQTVTVDVSSLTPAELDAAAVYFLVFSEIESAPAAGPVYYTYSGGGGFGGGSGGGFGGFGSLSRFDYTNTSAGGATAGSGGNSTPGDPGSGGGGGSAPAPAPAEKQFLTRLGDGDYVVSYGLLNEDDSFTKPTEIKFGSNVLTLNYSDTGVFQGSSNDELLDVVLASVGLNSLDSLVAGEIAANATKSLLPSAQTLQLQDVWSRIGDIALKPNKDYDTLTQDKQLKLLNFQENLLKATALTDEFTGYTEDKELLEAIVELGNVYADINKLDSSEVEYYENHFLSTLWLASQDSDIQKAAQELELVLKEFDSPVDEIKNSLLADDKGIGIHDLLCNLGIRRSVTAFEPLPKFRNSNGLLTDGNYTVVRSLMEPHETGYPFSGQSQFLTRYTGEAADILALDAAALADRLCLWQADPTSGISRKAKVQVFEPDSNGLPSPAIIGTLGDGTPTSWITVHRRANGNIHAHPSAPIIP